MKLVNRSYTTLSVVTLALALASCASGHLTATTRVQTEHVPKVSKTMILMNVESRHFNKALVSGLQESLTSSFASCGVVVEMHTKDPLDLNPKESMSKAMNAFQPDSVLTILRTGGEVLIGDGGNNASFDVTLRFSTVKPREEFWTAKTDISVLTANLFTNDKKSGQTIGNKLFELMRKDGLVCNAR